MKLLIRLRSERGSLRGDASTIPAYTGAPAPITIPTTTTVYSRSFKLNYGQSFGIQIKAANGSGSASMKVELEQSNTLLTEAQEGASSANYVVADGVTDIYSNLNDTNTHIKAIFPAPSKYARFKITGLGSNPADATVNVMVFQQELIC